jgi:hypothetical protein
LYDVDSPKFQSQKLPIYRNTGGAWLFDLNLPQSKPQRLAIPNKEKKLARTFKSRNILK